MADLAKYVRIYDPSPQDDTVNKREAAIKDAVAQLRKITTVTELVGLGAAIAEAFSKGACPDPLGSTVASAIKKHASAFVREERELEVAVVSVVAIMELLEGPESANYATTKDFIAATLWSALAFQKPIKDTKFEELRQELLSIVSDRCLNRASTSRKRSNPPKEIPTAPEGDVSQLGKSFAVATQAVSALQTNALLDREELDILWWALGGRSPTTELSYDEIDPAIRGTVRGVELGILLRRVPAQSHRSLALSNVPQVEAQTLSELVAKLEPVRDKLVSKIPARETIQANVVAFPLLNAIITGKAKSGGVAKSGDEWCGRAVLEAGLASLCETPIPRI